MRSIGPDPKVTSMTDRFKLSATMRFTDHEGTFRDDLRKLLDSYQGSLVEAPHLGPTSEDLLLLGLSDRTVTALVKVGIETRADLTSLTEEEVIARPDIGWMSLRDVVVHLHRAGLSLKDAPKSEELLELLPLSKSAYRVVRESARIVFRRVDDLVDADILTMRSALGGRNADEVIKVLGPRRADFDPPLLLTYRWSKGRS